LEKKSIKVTLNKNKYRPYPDNKYKVRLVSIDEREMITFGWRDVYIFNFRIIDGEFAGCPISKYINKIDGEIGPTSELWKTIEGMTGEDINFSKEYDLYGLIGKECTAHVELRKGERVVNRIYKLEPLHVKE